MTPLPIAFPSEAEQLRQYLAPYANATAEESLLAVGDVLDVALELSKAGGRCEEEVRYYEAGRREWLESVRKFIAEQLAGRRRGG